MKICDRFRIHRLAQSLSDGNMKGMVKENGPMVDWHNPIEWKEPEDQETNI
jgi:hypothetical protein